MAEVTTFAGTPGKEKVQVVSECKPMPVKMQGAGASAFTSVFGELAIGQRLNDILVQFQYSISSFDVGQTVTGTGSIAHANSMANIHSGTGVGKAVMDSVHHVRYRPGHESFDYFTAMFTTPEAGVTQLIGLMDDEHGYNLGYDGVDLVCGMRNTTDDFSQTTFLDNLDGDGPSKFTLDPATLNIFKISYGWLGIAPIVFQIYTGFLTGWIVFAYIDRTNKDTSPTTGDPSLHMRMEVDRASGSGADIIMSSASWCAGSVVDADSDKVGARHFSKKNSKAISATTLTNILTIKMATTFQSKDNHVEALLALVSAACDGAKLVDIELWKNATLGGTPSYTDVDDSNSISSFDIAGTTVSNGEFILALNLGKADGDVLDLHEQDIGLHPGDTLTVAAYSAGASDVDAALRWAERF